MENGRITDAQIKANHFKWLSTGARTHYSGLSSRLNGEAVGTLGGGWRPDDAVPYDQQWLQVTHSHK